MKWLSLLAFSLMAGVARADVPDLLVESHEVRNSIQLSIENSRFDLGEGTIDGSGARAAFSHSFGRSFSGLVYLGTAVNSDSGVQSSFTGLGGMVNYTLFGQAESTERKVSVGGLSYLTEKTEPGNVFNVGLGVDQYFLNGSKAVYSASGLSVGASYEFNLFSYRFNAAVRSGTMTANKKAVQSLFYGFGIVFPL